MYGFHCFFILPPASGKPAGGSQSVGTDDSRNVPIAMGLHPGRQAALRIRHIFLLPKGNG